MNCGTPRKRYTIVRQGSVVFRVVRAHPQTLRLKFY